MGQGEVGEAPKGANSMAMSELACRKALVGTGRAISILFGINKLRNKPSDLVGPPLVAFMAHFSASQVGFSREP